MTYLKVLRKLVIFYPSMYRNAQISNQLTVTGGLLLAVTFTHLRCRQRQHSRQPLPQTPLLPSSSSSSPTVTAVKPKGPKLNFEELNILTIIGTGTFGRVKLVQHKPSKRALALKCMAKSQIVQSHQERNIMNEKNILDECSHPFVLEQVATYQNANELFILMEIIQGGELWSYIYEKLDVIPRSSLGGFVEPVAQVRSLFKK